MFFADDLSFTPLTSSSFEERLWESWHFISLWAVLSSSLPALTMAVPIFRFGFTWWQVLIMIFIAQWLSLGTVILLGKPGSKYGVPFVLVSRSSFGIRGSRIITFLRYTFSVLGYTALTYMTSMLVLFMVLSWDIGFADIPTVFPESWNITIQNIIVFVITWLIFLPPSFFKVEDMRHVILSVAIFMVIFFIALIIWTAVSVGSPGPLLSGTTAFTSYGSFFLAFLSFTCYMYGFFFVFALGYSDFTRMGNTPESSSLGTLLGLPLFGTLFCFFGILLVSMIKGKYYGLDNSMESIISETKNTPLITIFTIVMLLSGSIANWAFNTVSGALITVSFFPKLNLRIAGLFTAICSLLLYPLSLAVYHGINVGGFQFLVGSMPSFYDSLNALGIFVAPVVGIVLVDYLFINDQSLDIEELSFATGRYWFSKGYNWRAFVAFLVGILAIIPGLIGLSGVFASSFGNILFALYGFSYVIGLLISGLFYFGIMSIFPPAMYDDEVLEMTVQRHRNTFSEKDFDKDANVLGI